jgi:hypothetical protein
LPRKDPDFDLGGACPDVKTTPLLSIAEGLEAMKKAGSSGFMPITARK